MIKLWSKAIWRAAIIKEIYWPSNALLFLRILLFVAASPIILRRPLPRLLRWLEPKSPCHIPDPARVDRIVRFSHYLLVGNGPFAGRTCLRRALTLYYFLSREGVELSIQFGVAPDDGKLIAHCWLVKDGEPYLEHPDPRPMYSPIFSSHQQGESPPLIWG